MPGQHDVREFPDALEAVSQHPDDVDERKQHDAQVREVRARAAAETGLDPFRARQHIGTPQPRADKHHQKNLVEHGPDPRQPDALQPVNEQTYTSHIVPEMSNMPEAFETPR